MSGWTTASAAPTATLSANTLRTRRSAPPPAVSAPGEGTRARRQDASCAQRGSAGGRLVTFGGGGRRESGGRRGRSRRAARGPAQRRAAAPREGRGAQTPAPSAHVNTSGAVRMMARTFLTVSEVARRGGGGPRLNCGDERPRAAREEKRPKDEGEMRHALGATHRAALALAAPRTDGHRAAALGALGRGEQDVRVDGRDGQRERERRRKRERRGVQRDAGLRRSR
jgi:hypothetical protein